MERNEKETIVNLDISNILKNYIRSGCIKTIKKISNSNWYRITINTETPTKVMEIVHHLNENGYQTRNGVHERTKNFRHSRYATDKSRMISEIYLIAKVAAPPKPQNPKPFDKTRKNKALAKKKRGYRNEL